MVFRAKSYAIKNEKTGNNGCILQRLLDTSFQLFFYREHGHTIN